MKLRLRTYDTEQGLLVAVCDEDLLGETFRDGDVRLEVSEDFYGGPVSGVNEVESELVNASIANLVGEESVRVGVDAGLIDKENVLYVEGVPHAQMVRI